MAPEVSSVPSLSIYSDNYLVNKSKRWISLCIVIRSCLSANPERSRLDHPIFWSLATIFVSFFVRNKIATHTILVCMFLMNTMYIYLLLLLLCLVSRDWERKASLPVLERRIDHLSPPEPAIVNQHRYSDRCSVRVTMGFIFFLSWLSLSFFQITCLPFSSSTTILHSSHLPNPGASVSHNCRISQFIFDALSAPPSSTWWTFVPGSRQDHFLRTQSHVTL